MSRCNKCGKEYYGLSCSCNPQIPQKVWVTCTACRGTGYQLTHHPGSMPCTRCFGKRGWYENKY